MIEDDINEILKKRDEYRKKTVMTIPEFTNKFNITF
jgi:hypothetical protein